MQKADMPHFAKRDAASLANSRCVSSSRTHGRKASDAASLRQICTHKSTYKDILFAFKIVNFRKKLYLCIPKGRESEFFALSTIKKTLYELQ